MQVTTKRMHRNQREKEKEKGGKKGEKERKGGKGPKKSRRGEDRKLVSKSSCKTGKDRIKATALGR